MSTVNVVDQGSVVVLELNRPEALNAMNVEMLGELEQVLDEVSKNEKVKVLIVRGSGNAFSAGGDIKMMLQDNVGGDFDEVMDMIGSIVTKLYTMPKVTISAIHGAAAGLGLSFALASDFVIAHTSTKLAMNFIKIGLIPDGGGHFFMEKRLGEAKAKQMIWEGRTISAEEAQGLGLVDSLAGEQMEEEMSKKVATLLQSPLQAMLETKMIYAKQSLPRLEQILDLEKNAQSRMRQSADHKEGIKAFVEKRKPQFSGK
ncbi:enoyl-CoA hydratase [Bacillus sp. CHD6a]|uniref:enoyl-CoA hydratase n=1 Tax=Bacillus sp. CHD6a TaxID=1643452 RepID=UPI0006CDA309|nr:enoyl-CoA hydratase [Bacillus sp. CHD6a]KPB04933.1 enoyl-CoA hydratase [Bacillus sp. CHD6a]